MSIRAVRRAKRLGEELQANLADDPLPKELPYELDRRGSASKRRKIEAEINMHTVSIAKLKGSKSTKAEVAVMKRVQKKSELAAEKEVQSQLRDLWNDEPPSSADNPIRRKSSMSRSHGGLSYHPSFDKHQEALAEALALELRHREKIQRESAKQLSTITSTPQGLEEDSDSENDGEAQSTEDVVSSQRLSRRKSERLTKAKKNKIRARKIAKNERAKLLDEKALLQSIDKAPIILKELEAEEQRRNAEAELKQLTASTEETGMKYEEAGLVPLSDELRGSLRAMVPKGVAIKLVENGMRDSGMLMSRTRRARRSGETPHANKRVKWIAKYKYP